VAKALASAIPHTEVITSLLRPPNWILWQR